MSRPISNEDGRMDQETPYYAQCPHYNVGRGIILRHHFRNEVRSHADDANKGNCLKDSDNLEGPAQGTILGSSHGEYCKKNNEVPSGQEWSK